MSTQTDEIVEDVKPVYDWSPPTGEKQDFYYKGTPITRDHVCLYSRDMINLHRQAIYKLQQVRKMFENSKIRECRGHKEKVHTVAWNCDGRKLGSGSVDKTARVWSPHRGVR